MSRLVRIAATLGCVFGVLLIASACTQTCPTGYYLREGRCYRGSPNGVDAGAEQESAVREDSVQQSEAGVSTLDAATAADASSSNAVGNAGGAGASGSAGDPSIPAAGSGGASGSAAEPVPQRNCLVGATRCSDAEAAVEVCTVDDEWTLKEMCIATCKDGACVGDCAPGEHHCGAKH
jgi:hypothetical protein